MKTLRLGLLVAVLSIIPFLIAGCDPSWGVTVKAWLDTNSNGLPDPGESPLSGIPFHGVVVGISNTVTVTTNANGIARLVIFFTDLHPEGEAFPDVPPQYTLTTAGRYKGASSPAEKPILFGFTYTPGSTPKPRPPVSVACACWEIERGQAAFPEIKDIALAADGSAWVIANWPVGGYAHVLPDTPPGKLTLTPVAQKYPRQIAVGTGGDAWLATEEGLVHIRDGNQRVFLGAPFAEEPNSLLDVAALPNGNVLVSGWHGGIALFDPHQASWITHPLSTTRMTDFRRASDGAVWGVNMGESVYLVPLALPTGDLVQGVAPRAVQIPVWSLRREIAPDGAWWFSGRPDKPGERAGDALVRRDLAARQFTRYDRQPDPSPLDDEWIPSLAAAPDGSVFVGTTHNGLLHLRPETKQWRAYTAADGLPSDYIGLVAVVAADTVWIAACNPAGPACDYDDGNYRPLGWINLLARCTIDEPD